MSATATAAATSAAAILAAINYAASLSSPLLSISKGARYSLRAAAAPAGPRVSRASRVSSSTGRTRGRRNAQVAPGALSTRRWFPTTIGQIRRPRRTRRQILVARAALYKQIADSLQEEADQEEEDSLEEEGSIEL
ncbi:hypothetical protein ACEPPN_015283 [Leptodophora sp. 'Broadleaf-Isolate-01']